MTSPSLIGVADSAELSTTPNDEGKTWVSRERDQPNAFPICVSSTANRHYIRAGGNCACNRRWWQDLGAIETPRALALFKMSLQIRTLGWRGSAVTGSYVSKPLRRSHRQELLRFCKALRYKKLGQNQRQATRVLLNREGIVIRARIRKELSFMGVRPSLIHV